MKTLIRIPSFLIALVLALACIIELSPKAQAVSPAPDGGYPGGNTAEGQDALLNLTTGVWNTALGAQALNHDNIGHQNTATGYQSLFSNTVGGQNTASGARSLFSNVDGQENTAIGYQSLSSNTIGGQNTASGAWSLVGNVNGLGNTADGYKALLSNISGAFNTAVGASALSRNLTGSVNTAIGAGALSRNANAELNTAIGGNALEFDRTGSANTAIGYAALDRNRTGDKNTATGNLALYNNASGSGNTAIGQGAGFYVVTASNVTCIGAEVLAANVSNTTWIGNVYGVTTQNATTAPVIVSADGQLGTVASSERFKKDIATMEKASEAILSLRPVTFHYKTDSKSTPQFGLIAEEVAKVNSALVLPDKEGKPYTVRYEAVNAMLLNEFLKEHRKVQELEANASRQQKRIEALTAGLQKVSAQLEMSRRAPQTVSNKQ
jgi:hypothetical protein